MPTELETNVRNVCKFFRYAVDAHSFLPSSAQPPSPQALEAARRIRGCDRGPALIIHGIMPRSGTVYVGELLRLHPDLFAYPGHVWEFPFLRHTPRIVKLENEFLWSYKQNFGKIGPNDFLPLFGASLIAYFHAAVPPGRRLLLKVPGVEHLDRFFDVFPHENLLVLVRDGRDVVQSTLKTWPQLRFSMVCIRWRRAAQMVVACDQRFRSRAQGYWLARFEDAVADPEGFVREACRRFGLDEDRYPYDQIGSIPVHGSSTTQVRGRVTWDPVPNKDFNPVGRWTGWSPYRKWLFKKLAGQPLQALGYAADQRW